MNSKVTKTAIHDDGLRYKSKVNGSPFGGAGSSTYSTKSCFFCGEHRGVGQRTTQKILGRHEPVCMPLCEKNPKFGKESKDDAKSAA